MWIFLAVALFLTGCAEDLPTMADLPPAAGSTDSLVHFTDRNAAPTAEDVHNILLPHRHDDPDHVFPFKEPCDELNGRKFCFTTESFGTRIRVSARTPDGTTYVADPLGGTLFDRVRRLFGAAPATIRLMVRYDDETIGLQLPTAFLVYRRDHFCRPFATERNVVIQYAFSNSGSPLFFSPTRPTEGWRRYDLDWMCRIEEVLN